MSTPTALFSRIAAHYLDAHPELIPEYEAHGGRMVDVAGGVELWIGDTCIGRFSDEAIAIGLQLEAANDAN